MGHVGVLSQGLRAAMGAALRVAHGIVQRRHGLPPTVGAVPDGDAMAPPELPADTPVADVLHPVLVGAGEVLRHDADLAIAHDAKSRLRQRPRTDPPLQTDARLDDSVAAVAVS